LYILLSLVLIIIGSIMFFKPNVFYKITESWKSDTYGEPSYLFQLSTRVGGLIFILVGFLGFIVFFFFNE